MGYAIKNLLVCIKKELMIFLLILLCVSSSVVVVHFAYGLYQNYHIILEEGENDCKELLVAVNRPEDVTRRALQDCLTALPPEINDAVYMYMVRPVIPGVTDQGDDRGWGSIIARFTVRGGGIAVCETFGNNITKNGVLTQGVYFDAGQEARGDLVAIVGPAGTNDNCTDFLTTRMEGKQRYIGLQGKEYKVIGMQKMTNSPLVPFLSLDESTPMNDSIGISFRDVMTRAQYDTVRAAMESAFGDAVTVPELDIPETEQRYLYRTILMICAAIALLAAANFAVLYQYLLEQRSKQIAVFRICGCKKRHIICIFMAECAMVMLPAYGLSVLGFARLILPRCAALYPHMAAAYSGRIYAAIFCIYTAVSLTVLVLLIRRTVGTQSLAAMKGGTPNG